MPGAVLDVTRAEGWHRAMENYRPAMSFDEDVAASYDARSQRGDEESAPAFLERWARGGPALELAIGTGRIALPLAARGVRVDGIELAPAMVDRLRAKPGGDRLSVTIGDFAEVPVEGRYRLIYVVFNTLYNLITQDDQVRCFENVAAHLTDHGVFVVEAFTPGYLHRLQEDQYVLAEGIGLEEVRLDVARHDATRQLLEKNHIAFGPGGIGFNPIVLRYVWPGELDLMARIAGLRLVERWAGWHREPFTSASRAHVSVYGR
jgi:SAM-dependent methyltransferase